LYLILLNYIMKKIILITLMMFSVVMSYSQDTIFTNTKEVIIATQIKYTKVPSENPNIWVEGIYYNDEKGVRKNIMMTLVKSVSEKGAKSNSIDGVPLDSITARYILLVGTSKFLSNDINISVQFGQKQSLFQDNASLRDSNGKLLTLHSMTDALNFFSDYNYSFKQAYVVTVGTQNVYHYLMEKDNKK